MCRRVECPKCHRPTFAGCGAHVEQVLGDVPKADRCRCAQAAAGAAQPASSSGPSAEKEGWVKKLFAR